MGIYFAEKKQEAAQATIALACFDTNYPTKKTTKRFSKQPFKRLFLRLAEGGEELLIWGGRGGSGEAFAFGEGSPIFGCVLVGKG